MRTTEGQDQHSIGDCFFPVLVNSGRGWTFIFLISLLYVYYLAFCIFSSFIVYPFPFLYFGSYFSAFHLFFLSLFPFLLPFRFYVLPSISLSLSMSYVFQLPFFSSLLSFPLSLLPLFFPSFILSFLSSFKLSSPFLLPFPPLISQHLLPSFSSLKIYFSHYLSSL